MLTCQQESFSEAFPEVKRLWKLHWDETEGYRHVLGYNPDVEAYMAYDRSGSIRLYTARRDGELVGQAGFLVYKSRHTSKVAAGEDFFYVVESERGKGVARDLMRFALLDMRDEGIQQVLFGDKEPSNLGPFLEKFGFKQVSKQYSLVF